MLKRSISFILVIGLVASVFGAEFKHPTATVKAKGSWKQDSESNNDLLILDSDPKGRQIVISVLRADREAANVDQVAQATARIFEQRLAAAQKFSPDVKFDKPEVTTTASTVVCVCRGFAATAGVRMVFRIDGSTKSVRSVSVYDYSNPTAEAFQKWSKEILAGIK